MRDMMKKMKEFHEKMGAPCAVKFPMETSPELVGLGSALQDTAKDLEKRATTNVHLLRVHLLIEELGEYLEAVGRGDEVEALDGLTDLLYVVVGTAVTYDWPLRHAFNEVHRANMTKRPESVRREDRDKGSWSPPRLRKVLDAYRNCWPPTEE